MYIRVFTPCARTARVLAPWCWRLLCFEHFYASHSSLLQNKLALVRSHLQLFNFFSAVEMQPTFLAPFMHFSLRRVEARNKEEVRGDSYTSYLVC